MTKTPDGDLNAVAVIEHTERAIQPTDATKYTLRLSVANQQKLAAYANKMDDTDVEH